MRINPLAVLIVLQFGLLTSTAALAESKIFTSWGKAIRGYDPVAYFTESNPVEGNSKFTHEWKGAKWYFSSAENRDKFKADPDAFAPQYGGYCAWGMKEGYTASIEADAWTIVDGKLYLNYSTSIKEKWRKDIPAYIATADKNWLGVEKTLEE